MNPPDGGGLGRLRKKLRRRESQFGYIVTGPSTKVVRCLAEAGCDFVVIDMEHSAIDLESMQTMIMATAGTDCSPLVRVPRGDEVFIKPALDSGAVGIWVPHVETADQVRLVVDAARYPPEGRRGVGPHQAASRWGLTPEEYIARANGDVVVGILIESRDAVERLDEMVAVPGVDVVSVARGDLAASAGHLGDIEHEDVRELVRHAEEIVRKSGLVLGEVARTRDEARSFAQSGHGFVCLGTEVGALYDHSTALLGELRPLSG